MPKKREYHFSLGDSSTGPVGFCSVVRATSKKAALEILRDVLQDHEIRTADSRIEYLTVYFNPSAVTTADIDEVIEE